MAAAPLWSDTWADGGRANGQPPHDHGRRRDENFVGLEEYRSRAVTQVGRKFFSAPRNGRDIWAAALRLPQFAFIGFGRVITGPPVDRPSAWCPYFLVSTTRSSARCSHHGRSPDHLAWRSCVRCRRRLASANHSPATAGIPSHHRFRLVPYMAGRARQVSRCEKRIFSSRTAQAPGRSGSCSRCLPTSPRARRLLHAADRERYCSSPRCRSSCRRSGSDPSWDDDRRGRPRAPRRHLAIGRRHAGSGLS